MNTELKMRQLRPRRWALVLLLAQVPIVAWLVLFAKGWTINRLNVRIWIALSGKDKLLPPMSPEDFSRILNVALTIPTAALLILWRPGLRMWWVVLAGALASSGVELTQLLMGSRDAQVDDIMMNTLGAVIGVLIGRGGDLLLRYIHHKTSSTSNR